MSNPVTPSSLKSQYPGLADLGNAYLQLFIDDAYESHSENSFLSANHYHRAVELYVMRELVAANPNLKQQYQKTRERIVSQEGSSKEEYESYTSQGDFSQAGRFANIFDMLYQKHLRRSIVTTRVYP